MFEIKEIATIKNHRITIDLPESITANTAEVIIKPIENLPEKKKTKTFPKLKTVAFTDEINTLSYHRDEIYGENGR